MQIKITDPGFAGYTGAFGAVNFVDGVSEEVSAAEAQSLGNILRVEVLGTGENPSITHKMAELRDKNMDEMGSHRAFASEGPVSVSTIPNDAGDKLFPVADKAEMRKAAAGLDFSYSEDDLAELVKKEGIAGLRAFAEGYDVNDRSIAGMVKKLMDLKGLQGVKQVQADTQSAVQTEVVKAHLNEAAEQGEPGDAAKALTVDGVPSTEAVHSGAVGSDQDYHAIDHDAADISDVAEIEQPVVVHGAAGEAAQEAAQEAADEAAEDKE